MNEIIILILLYLALGVIFSNAVENDSNFLLIVGWPIITIMVLIYCIIRILVAAGKGLYDILHR